MIVYNFFFVILGILPENTVVNESLFFGYLGILVILIILVIFLRRRRLQQDNHDNDHK